jgi:hypothetical protein
MDPLRGLGRNTRVQREARRFGHLPPRPFRLARQRLQREELLALSGARRGPVRDRSPEQRIDGPLLARIESCRCQLSTGRGRDSRVLACGLTRRNFSIERADSLPRWRARSAVSPPVLTRHDGFRR